MRIPSQLCDQCQNSERGVRCLFSLAFAVLSSVLTLVFNALLFSDPTLGFQGQLDKVEQLKKDLPNVHVLDQFANAANPEAHFTWTGTYPYKMLSD